MTLRDSPHSAGALESTAVPKPVEARRLSMGRPTNGAVVQSNGYLTLQATPPRAPRSPSPLTSQRVLRVPAVREGDGYRPGAPAVRCAASPWFGVFRVAGLGVGVAAVHRSSSGDDR